MHNPLIPNIVLNDQSTMPALGFGTYKLNGSEGVASIVSATKAGYRMLDSAFKYENEGTLGKSIVQSGIPREELYVISKLPGRHHRYNEALYTIEESLYRMRLDYFDLYLIHWPIPRLGLYVEAWQALIEAKKRGLIRSIGVCNFLPEHLQKLIDETGVTPVTNQVELHPYFPQQKLRDWHKRHGIVTQSWSPLGRASKVLQEPIITAISEKYGKTVPQVILRWHVQLDAVPLPKSTSKERQLENLSIFDFELTPDDITAICSLAKVDGRRQDRHPALHEEF